MDKVNLVVHIFSGLAFLVIIFMYLKMQKRHRLVLSLLNSAADSPGPKVIMDTPTNFLKRFCFAFGIPLEIDGAVGGEFQKINARPWVESHTRAGISGVICSSHEDHIHVQLSYRNSNEVSKLNLGELKASLGKRAEIKLS